MKTIPITAEEYLRDQPCKDKMIGTLDDSLKKCEQQIQQDNNNSTLHEEYNRTIQASSIGDAENQYQEVYDYGTDSDTQNNPVIARRQRENMKNNRKRQQSMHTAAEHS